MSCFKRLCKQSEFIFEDTQVRINSLKDEIFIVEIQSITESKQRPTKQTYVKLFTKLNELVREVKFYLDALHQCSVQTK